MEFQSFEEIRERVEASEGVLTVSMRSLRDAHGAGKLGVHVRAGIGKALLSQGLAHYPPELPEQQYDVVRIYLQGSPVADRINAVLNLTEDSDDHLRQWVTGDAEDTLRRVKELVCDW